MCAYTQQFETQYELSRHTPLANLGAEILFSAVAIIRSPKYSAEDRRHELIWLHSDEYMVDGISALFAEEMCGVDGLVEKLRAKYPLNYDITDSPQKKRAPDWTKAEEARLYELLAEGLTYGEIAKAIGRSRPSVYLYHKRISAEWSEADLQLLYRLREAPTVRTVKDIRRATQFSIAQILSKAESLGLPAPKMALAAWSRHEIEQLRGLTKAQLLDFMPSLVKRFGRSEGAIKSMWEKVMYGRK